MKSNLDNKGQSEFLMIEHDVDHQVTDHTEQPLPSKRNHGNQLMNDAKARVTVSFNFFNHNNEEESSPQLHDVTPHNQRQKKFLASQTSYDSFAGKRSQVPLPSLIGTQMSKL